MTDTPAPALTESDLECLENELDEDDGPAPDNTLVEYSWGTIKRLIAAAKRGIELEAQIQEAYKVIQFFENKPKSIPEIAASAILQARLKEAEAHLEWYASRARDIAKQDWKNNPHYAEAVFTELSLDEGKRADAYRLKYPSEKKEERNGNS